MWWGQDARYDRDGCPGGAMPPMRWWNRYERIGEPVPIDYADKQAFRRWRHHFGGTGRRPDQSARGCGRWCSQSSSGACSSTLATPRRNAGSSGGSVRWLSTSPTWSSTRWSACSPMSAAVRRWPVQSPRRCNASGESTSTSPADTRDAGFIEIDHFGVRFPHRASHCDLTGISQRCCGIWSGITDRSVAVCAAAPHLRRLRRNPSAATELGVFLEKDAPEGGHDPQLLDGEHLRRFVADQRARWR